MSRYFINIFFIWILVLITYSITLANMNILTPNLKKHVFLLAKKIGTRNYLYYKNLEQTCNYINNYFNEYGYNAELQTYNIDNREFHNIIAIKKGDEHSDKIVVVGAHYDTVTDTPGADDNASGVAVLLEISRLFSKMKTDKTIKFIAFVNEEPPFFRSKLMGSYVASKIAFEKREDIFAMICLEMVGYFTPVPDSQHYPPFLSFFYPSCGNFITIVGNISSGSLVSQLKEKFKKYSDFPVESISAFKWLPGIDFSDHLNYWENGYKAVMITDTAFYRNPNYHKSCDTPETLDYIAMGKITETLFYVLNEMCQK
ncbi:MAG: M28 family peptidase [Candidatus Firestonebacteria bacterium]|nr:M28 family peptidase [Candidatus Firestonebacteria bacterium]